MRFGLNDDTVKRIAALAFHAKGDMLGNISGIYRNITEPETISMIANAHETDAMLHRFKDKDEENSFKVYLAKASAINRGTLDPKPETVSSINKSSKRNKIATPEA